LVTAYVLVVVALAAARVWVLVGKDEITEPVRDRLPARVAGWLECPYCAGAWVAFGAVGAFYLGVPLWVFEAFAVAMAVVIVALVMGRLSD
jgi:hypothetical protein